MGDMARIETKENDDDGQECESYTIAHKYWFRILGKDVI